MKMKHEKVLWEMWAAFNAFRNLGFNADDVFAFQGTEANPQNLFRGEVCGFIELRTQGKTFRVNCGPIGNDLSDEQFETFWRDQCSLVRRVPDRVLKRMWEDSHAYKNGKELVVALLAKFFTIPGSPTRLN